MDGHGFIVAGTGGGFSHPPPDGPTRDTSEQEMLNIAAEYKKVEKDELPPVKLATAKVGKQAANKHLEQLASNFKSSDIGWTFGTC